jgi:hypothetical protein
LGARPCALQHTAKFGEEEAKKLFVVVKETEDVVLWKAVAALEEIELNGESKTCDFAA